MSRRNIIIIAAIVVLILIWALWPSGSDTTDGAATTDPAAVETETEPAQQ
jgi:hypothetical protein